MVVPAIETCYKTPNRAKERLMPITRDDVERIHETSLRLLQDPGVKLEHDAVCEKLREAGATDGREAQVLRFPRPMIEEYLALAPKSVRFSDLDGHVTELGPGSPSCFWTGAALNVLDLDGDVREITSHDLAGFARLVDALDGVHALVGTAMSDVPPPHRDFVGLRVMAQNTRKHLRALSFTPTGAEAMREMARVLAGVPLADRPVLSMGFTAHGPLRWTNLALDIYFRSAGDKIPVTVNGEPSAGASGPVTLAGALAVGNAEVLAGIVLNQVIEPGRPCIHNLGFSHIMDMKTAMAVTGGPEVCLLAAAGAELARFYGLPSCSWMCTEAMLPDEQAALETLFGCLTHGQAGVNIVWGVGQLESEKTISPVKAVMDNELIGMVRRFERGIEVSGETLAEDVAREVGIAGSFLGTTHTFEHFRTEFYEPRLLCRVNRDGWTAAGAKRLSDTAADRARELLAADREPLLDDDAAAELKKIDERYVRMLT
jgi:trimethylamine--corrinoid protein Co-methyltransferase